MTYQGVNVDGLEAYRIIKSLNFEESRLHFALARNPIGSWATSLRYCRMESKMAMSFCSIASIFFSHSKDAYSLLFERTRTSVLYLSSTMRPPSLKPLVKNVSGFSTTLFLNISNAVMNSEIAIKLFFSVSGCKNFPKIHQRRSLDNPTLQLDFRNDAVYCIRNSIHHC